MIRPKLPIILLEDRERVSNIPDGVDAVVPVSDLKKLLSKIEELLSMPQSRAAG